ncbi:hypothetical protein EJA10_10370 [Mesobacillus subterraneus]|uniref:YqfQ-like protein n=2 Tax=Mesobacillus subterraneus TaxID=285983 RepID=A0A427TSS1_9BACI|nr:hypothetical protein EJA10_10370 [Mesobacillus subterraneus]
MGQRQMYYHPYGQMPMMPQGQMPRMMGRGRPSRQGGGGLLAKILGKGGQSQRNGPAGLLSGGQSAARGVSQGDGILKTLTDPSAINGFLTNTQKVLSTAQQFGPMIQQYGPLVRNLPSMWKLYKGLKDLPDADEQSKEETKESSEQVENTGEKKTEKTARKRSKKKTSEHAAKKPSMNGGSSPKLFI